MTTLEVSDPGRLTHSTSLLDYKPSHTTVSDVQFQKDEVAHKILSLSRQLESVHINHGGKCGSYTASIWRE